MEKPLCTNSTAYDRECDPEVAAKRNQLFQQYVSPYYNMIYKLVMNYTYNPANVEENYTEVLVNFFRRIETYDPSRSIHTWLHIVTKRMVAELEKRRRRNDNKDFDKDIEDYEECGDDDELVDKNAKFNGVYDAQHISSNCMGIENWRQMYNDDIIAVLDQMKPIHRDAVLLQEAGYSLREIADIEYAKGTLKSHNIETVKSRLFLARQFLKKHLNRNGERIKQPTNTDGVH